MLKVVPMYPMDSAEKVLEDDWTKSQGWYLVNAVLPNFQELSKLPFQELCQQLQSLLAVV